MRSAIDYYRKYHQHKIALVGVDEVPEVAVHDHILSQIAAEDLRTLVQQLPPAYRLAINLYAIEGFAHHEIADMLGISEGASKSNLFKARAKLTKMLEQQKAPNGLNVNNTP